MAVATTPRPVLTTRILLFGFRFLTEQILEGQLTDRLVVRVARLAVEEQLRVDPPVRGGHDRRPRAQLGEGLQQRALLRLPDPVGLVQDHQIGDGHMPVDLRVPGPGGPELRRVDDLDQSAVHDPVVLAGQDHADEFLRLGQTARLDHDHIDTGRRPGQPFQILVQLAGVDGAAQTAVAQRDHRVDLPGHRHGVDLDAAEVVDDRSDAAAAAAAQQVVEQGRLAGTEESGEHDDRNLSRGLRGQGGASIVVRRCGGAPSVRHAVSSARRAPAAAGADRHSGPPGG